jgi:hypothetical protein
MGANQNSSPKFGLCPKINPKPLSLTRSKPHSYSKAVSPRNQARNRSGTQNDVSKTTQEIDDKIDSKNSLSPFRHFTEHLADVFGKLPWENDLDRESSRLSIQWVNSTLEIQPASIMSTPTAIHNQKRAEQHGWTQPLKSPNQNPPLPLHVCWCCSERQSRKNQAGHCALRNKTKPCRWRDNWHTATKNHSVDSGNPSTRRHRFLARGKAAAAPNPRDREGKYTARGGAETQRERRPLAGKNSRPAKRNHGAAETQPHCRGGALVG